MHKGITKQLPIRVLWVFFGLTFPLFGFAFARLEVGGMYIAIPIVIPWAILGFHAVTLPIVRGFKSNERRLWIVNRQLAVCTFLFVLWFFLELFRAENRYFAMREMIRLIIAIGSMWIVVRFFPRDREFMDRFWHIILWSTTFLVAVFIYKYMFVFKSSYLGYQWEQRTRGGRNQMGFFISLIVPYAVCSLLDSSKKPPFNLPPLLVLITAWLYIGSRGAWVSVIVGLTSIFIMGRIKMQRVLLLVAILILCAWSLSQLLDIRPLYERSLTLYTLKESSIRDRIDIAETAWEYFIRSPVIGIGATNFLLQSSRDVFGVITETHNEYLTILAEMGIVGFTAFIAILATVLVKVWSPKSKGQVTWIGLGARSAIVAGLFHLLFINAFTTVMFWVSIGLALVISEIEAHPSRTA